ncbi:MAG: aspartate aminotransferase family protein [Candidatus Sericytochromatia bacterium]|nr:aspartate aminotransferase family protein [Candidatus Tanganyikabacteria bacterium]
MAKQAPLSAKDLKAKRERYIIPTVKHWYTDPPHFVRGEMQHLYDETGKEYLDFFGGICTVSVGHCNPVVTDAVVEQAKELQHTSTIFMSQPMVDLAEKLVALAPFSGGKAFLTNSGTEANETAIMLSKVASGRNEIIALKHSYHGRSWLAGSLTSNGAYRVDPMPVPGIVFAQNPYCYRCPFGLEYGSCEMQCVKALEETIQTQTNGEPAVMIAEPIQGVGGLIAPPPPYFSLAKQVLDKYGVLLIADEVQTGFGRTGEAFWGISSYGVEPDLVTMAKGIANGFAAGGCVAKAAVADKLQRPTINTFGGNPISSAAAMATIGYIEDRKLQDNASVVGGYLMDKLRELAEQYPIIGDVRGKGLMIGVELVKDRSTKEPAVDLCNGVLDLTKDAGLIIGKGGQMGCTLRIQPPLNITKADVDQAIAILSKALAQVSQAVLA